MDEGMQKSETNGTGKVLFNTSLGQAEKNEKTDELDDREPIVVLDDDREVTSPLSNDSQSYLRAQGITDECTWSSFRLGQVAETDLKRLLTATQPRHLRPGGIWLPTFDPIQSEVVVGLIRLTPAQNKHTFITPPMGIACTVDVATSSRIILADNPLLGFRLVQAGVVGVAIVEDPKVLTPLIPWLSERKVVVVGWRKERLEAMCSALGDFGKTVTVLPVSNELPKSPRESLVALGLDPDVLRAKPEKPDLTDIHLRDLIAYARGRLGSGDAMQALEAVEAHHPALVQAYRIGYLPTDFRRALHRDMRHALAGPRIAGGLMIPAVDEHDVAVDALIVHPCVRGRSNDGIAQEPLGLLGPDISRSHDEIIVTDTFRWLARLFHEGFTNVQLLRGPVDAEHNAARLVNNGVQRVTLRVRRNRDLFADILRRVGITVEVTEAPVTGDAVWEESETDIDQESPSEIPVVALTESSPTPLVAVTAPVAELSVTTTTEPSLRFVEEDRTALVMIFAAGPVQYAVEIRDDGDSRRLVTARSHGQIHKDRFDLISAPQCQRFASGAARRISIPATVIERHLALVWEMVRQREDAALTIPAASVDPTTRAGVEDLLSKPDLLDRIAADLTDLGWVGEERAKRLLYLTAISRMLPQPLWSVYEATAGGAPWQGLSLIAALTPDEDRIVFHRVTDALLAHTDQRQLRHKLLIVDQAETLRPEAALHLRVLHQRGAIGWTTLPPSTSPRGHASAHQTPLMGDARGPVAVLAAATSALNHRVRDCFMTLSVDESTQSTRDMVDDQQRRSGATSHAHPEAIIARHHALQRVLERQRVLIPFAERIDFPARSIRHRQDHLHFLSLIEASALLHQRQRTRDGVMIVASEVDFQIAATLVSGVLGTGGDGLSTMSRTVLGRVVAAERSTFDIPVLAELLPDDSPWVFHAAIRELRDLGYIETKRVHRRDQHQVTARGTAAAKPPAIRLRPVGAPAHGHVGRMFNFGHHDHSAATSKSAAG